MINSVSSWKVVIDMKILVTGGPVHALLDPVKMVTNRFKGGMMAHIAEKLSKNVDVIYLTAKGMKEPKGHCACGRCDLRGDKGTCGPVDQCEIVYHEGIDDYMEKVLELAPEMDAVVLGGAVANLIPTKLYRHGMGLPDIDEDTHQISDPVPLPLKEKFPSHDYKPGDRIFMEWTIAPRVIDQVKDVMKPTAHLFGFKLLAGHPHEELIRAAYEVLVESRASCVFANDASSKNSLMTKYAVTKERGVHEMGLDDVAAFIKRMMEDEYYSTISVKSTGCTDGVEDDLNMHKALIRKHHDKFVEVEDGHIFGTVAVRMSDTRYRNSFWTTARGKRDIEGNVLVLDVDHDTKIVTTLGDCQVPGAMKATLNAPLLHWIFKMYPQVRSIVHTHQFDEDFPTYPYAPPGTKRDSVRGLPCKSFNIEGHGMYVLLDEDGNAIWE
jgi:hypothetical protein